MSVSSWALCRSMSNLQSIQPRVVLTPEMISEVESIYNSLRQAKDGVEALHLPKIIKALGLEKTLTIETVSKSQGLLLSLDTLLQIVCQGFDSTTDAMSIESREVFDQFDADSDGLLEPFELQRVLNLMGEFAESDEIEEQIKAYDQHTDGENLAFADWKTMIQEQKGCGVHS